MGIAIASGVPPENAAAVGIITGIVGGLLVGLLAGSPLQVSGPAAGLAVIVGQFIAEYGFATLGLIVMVAGVVQVLAGLMRLGQWFRAMSPAVIQGMLAGIGMLIFAAQFHVMVDDVPPGSGVKFGGIINLYTIPEAIWKGVTEEVHQSAAGIGLLTILAIVGWTLFAPKKLKVVPAPLIAVLLSAAVAAALQLDINYIVVPDQLTDAIAMPAAGDWQRLLEWSILGAGLTLAFVASAESLLTATAADAMQQHAPRTKYDRELVAQGAGNLVCGLLGALPMTGVIVRTSANVHAGGRRGIDDAARTLAAGLRRAVPPSPAVDSHCQSRGNPGVHRLEADEPQSGPRPVAIWQGRGGDLRGHPGHYRHRRSAHRHPGWPRPGTGQAVVHVFPPQRASQDRKRPHGPLPEGSRHVHSLAQAGRRSARGPGQYGTPRPFRRADLHRSRLSGSC